MDLSKYYTLKQTMALLDRTRQGIEYLVDTGKLTKYKQLGRLYFLKEQVVSLQQPIEAA